MNYMGLYLLIGVCIVFAVYFMVKNSKPAAHKADDSKEVSMKQMTQLIDEKVDKELADNKELIAVISAAIAASMGSQSRIVVRNIRRVYDPTPVWAKTGRSDVMASRY